MSSNLMASRSKRRAWSQARAGQSARPAGPPEVWARASCCSRPPRSPGRPPRSTRCQASRPPSSCSAATPPQRPPRRAAPRRRSARDVGARSGPFAAAADWSSGVAVCCDSVALGRSGPVADRSERVPWAAASRRREPARRQSPCPTSPASQPRPAPGPQRCDAARPRWRRRSASAARARPASATRCAERARRAPRQRRVAPPRGLRCRDGDVGPAGRSGALGLALRRRAVALALGLARGGRSAAAALALALAVAPRRALRRLGLRAAALLRRPRRPALRLPLSRLRVLVWLRLRVLALARPPLGVLRAGRSSPGSSSLRAPSILAPITNGSVASRIDSSKVARGTANGSISVSPLRLISGTPASTRRPGTAIGPPTAQDQRQGKADGKPAQPGSHSSPRDHPSHQTADRPPLDQIPRARGRISADFRFTLATRKRRSRRLVVARVVCSNRGERGDRGCWLRVHPPPPADSRCSWKRGLGRA